MDANRRMSCHVAANCLVVAVLLVLLCSCLSFDIGDWPSAYVYPHNNPATNWCGSIGAFCAYYLLYYVGPGVFIALISGIWLFVARILGRPIGQPLLRAVGLVLLLTVASCSFYCIWPERFCPFPTGSGGILGVAAAKFLRSHFAVLGTFILIAATWLVGVLLLADALLLTAGHCLSIAIKKIFGFVSPAWSIARRHGDVLREIWRRLSLRQKEGFGKRDVPKLRRTATTQSAGKSEDENIAGTDEKVVGSPSWRSVKQDDSLVPVEYEDYILPPIDLLVEPESGYSSVQDKVVKAKAAALERLLNEFNIDARVVTADTGPVVTMFELELGAGVKVSQISTLSHDMARALGVGAVRVVAPLPGKHTIGIEVPNSEKERVRMKELMGVGCDKTEKMKIPLFLGKDSSGEVLVSDLTAMPHLLIAGTTGSGKSVCINSIIASILLTRRPDEVKMILIDPKMVEMTVFTTVPHLMSPIVTEITKSVQVLEWASVKMDERYALLAEARVKNISDYNSLGREEIINRFNPGDPDEEAKIPKKLPYIVVVVDELADLMMSSSKEIEAFIVRLAQKSRAVGIHLVMATQRPQATVVTGLIKSNMPTRIGFRVAARMDSRIILDQNGAETLLGQGDMLFLKPGTSDLIRAQGTFVDEQELKKVVKYLKDIAEPQFHPELTQLGRINVAKMSEDELFDDAVKIILESRRGSVSLLQRRLGVGYARASRMIEVMASLGVLGEYKGSQAREVMMTIEEYEKMRNDMEPTKEDINEDETEADSSDMSFINEGQKEYVAANGDDL